MTELEKKFIGQRLTDIKNGEYAPSIEGLPNLLFVKLDNKVKGIASRTYSKSLFEYLREGLKSEAMLPQMLKQTCADAGLDIKVLNSKVDLMKKIYDNTPDELQGPYDSLTEEEVEQLSPEENEARSKGIAERGKRILEHITNIYTPEDQEILNQIQQIEAIERNLRNNTAERYARQDQMVVELLHCCRRIDNPVAAYFTSVDEIADVDNAKRGALVQLFMKWAQFKEGKLPEYFRSDNTAQPGVGGNVAGTKA
jgi:hypothetical protein